MNQVLNDRLAREEGLMTVRQGLLWDLDVERLDALPTDTFRRLLGGTEA